LEVIIRYAASWLAQEVGCIVLDSPSYDDPNSFEAWRLDVARRNILAALCALTYALRSQSSRL
jgi:hypothetical protein